VASWRPGICFSSCGGAAGIPILQSGKSGGDFWVILSLKPGLERRGASVAIMIAHTL
ncbi:unnamed protein product, partial [Tetraodon nigroviridis]